MMSSQEVLSIYEAMVELTEQMVAAASGGDWERLALLEQRCAAHVATIRDCEPAPMQGRNRQKKAAIIKQLLADDRKIRDLTSPWMAQLSAMLNSSGAERRPASAYGGT